MGFLKSRKCVVVLVCVLACFFQFILNSNLQAEVTVVVVGQESGAPVVNYTPETTTIPEGTGQESLEWEDLEQLSIMSSGGGDTDADGKTDYDGIKPQIGPYNGSYSTQIPIEVPAFHGLEPKLALIYSSQGGDRFGGWGWDLSGISCIERGVPNGGAPKYDSNDVFFLDGMELVHLQDNDYTTETANFARIRFIENIWYVWGTNGNLATYNQVFNTSEGIFRWYLASVQDRHGNIVEYSYADDNGYYLYPSTISYNGTVITLYRESRSDPVLFSTGASLGRMNYRLKSVAVRTSDSLVRAYALAYAQTYPYTQTYATARSLLVGFQQFGNDASVDSSGNVSGGNALPAMAMTYTTESNATFHTRVFNEINFSLYNQVSHFNGDVNGDGKTDLILIGNDNTYIFLSHGDGRYNYDTGYYFVNSNIHDGQNMYGYSRMIGDVNADGKTDLVFVKNEDIHVYLSQGDGTFTHVQSADGVNLTGRSIYVADATGDGKADIIIMDDDTSCVLLSKGDGTFERHVQASVGVTYSAYARRFGDVNGDGKLDIIYAGSTCSLIFIGKGDGTFAPRVDYNYGYNFTTYAAPIVGDMNGDGKTDLIYINMYTSPTTINVLLSKGDGNFAPWVFQTYSGFGQYSVFNGYLTGDVDGDGKDDLTMSSGNNGVYLIDADSGYNLLASMTNGVGGTTSIEYEPSTASTDVNYLPVGFNIETVSRVTTNDGRGNYSYVDYDYAGALWFDAEAPAAGDPWPDRRRFLGFRKVTGTLKNSSNEPLTRVETLYHQKIGSISKPEYIHVKDPTLETDNLFRYSQFEYTENSAPPYTSLLTDRWEYECNLHTGGRCYATLLQYDYDEYGNITANKEWGRIVLDASGQMVLDGNGLPEANGDERLIVRGYSPNTTDYVVSLPAYENTYEGMAVDPTKLLKEQVFLYDGSTTPGTPPTVGDLTETRTHLNASDYAAVRMTYDTYGNPLTQETKRTNNDWYGTTIVYDGTYHIYPVAEYNALNHQTNTGWDYILGLKTSVEDVSNAATTAYAYDVFGRPTQETDPYGNITKTEYLDWSSPTLRRIRTTLAYGSSMALWSEEYQGGLGRKYHAVKQGPDADTTFRQVTAYDGATPRVTHESLWYKNDESTGQPAEMVQWMAYVYDHMGRRVEIRNPDHTEQSPSRSTVVYDNDDQGRPYTAYYDELGHEKVVWKDAYGNITQIREKVDVNSVEQSIYTTYVFDLLNRLIDVYDADNVLVSHTEWDSLGRKILSFDIDMGSWHYSYYLDGLLASQTDARGQTITLAYDDIGRILSKTHDTITDVQYIYDEAGHGASSGRLTSVTYPGGGESHTWDKLGQETSVTRTVSGLARTIDQTYDALGRVSSITYPQDYDGAEVVTYTYDGAGNLFGVSGYVTDMLWSASGQLLEMGYANGTRNSYTYDPQRRWLNSAEVIDAQQSTLYASTYAYDAAARVTAMNYEIDTVPTVNLTYDYDKLNRLTLVDGTDSEHDQAFQYDFTGNITSNSAYLDPQYTYDATHKHAVASAGGASYTYDDNGNMTAGGDKTFAWDAYNRLGSMTVPVGGEDKTVTFLYDADGRRIQRSILNSNLPNKYFGKMVYTYGGWMHKYIYAGNILVAKSYGKFYGDYTAPTKLWYHADHLGSTRIMTRITGARTNSYDYESFGESALLGGSASNDRTFTGHIEDPDLGLIYMVARYYDANLGRFISPDSLVPDVNNPQAFNRYSYVSNNPISNTDPTGHMEGRDHLEDGDIYWGMGQDIKNKYSNYFAPYQLFYSNSYNADSFRAGLITGTWDAIIPGWRLSSLSENQFRNGDYFYAGVNFLGAAAYNGMYYATILLGSPFWNSATKIESLGLKSVANEAHNAADALKLNKSLASQSQMSEAGTIMAGPGGRVPFRDAARVAQEYGGSASDWVKKTSASYTTRDGVQFETHWVENIKTGQRVEFKTKLTGGN